MISLFWDLKGFDPERNLICQAMSNYLAAKDSAYLFDKQRIYGPQVRHLIKLSILREKILKVSLYPPPPSGKRKSYWDFQINNINSDYLVNRKISL